MSPDGTAEDARIKDRDVSEDDVQLIGVCSNSEDSTHGAATDKAAGEAGERRHKAVKEAGPRNAQT
ncbi:uncharacterized protein MAM_08020 [Metarhizium album ARSEF 1941]|uniref:Uncharacterized protein n=1 Tax=Metarhizium album (strain ARSEF 1941) TaxID=1081103 RepID=A0A0B2WM47_METAS|nr:uncharacterized protein MAM_08020 [Metarhizium album ARSEF 1941]KHN94090.1 hypothetical protein MAM_08020 [Metarhizium album ARSEF 1941]